MSVRLAALNVLLALERGGTTLAAEVDRGRKGLRDERDRALLIELAAGTLRWRAELDARLTPCCDRPLDQLTPAVRSILRLGVYQLAHLDRIPAHAVLHESVELVRVMGEPRAAGFVNAVLRGYGRKRAHATLPTRPASNDDPSAQLAYLSTTLSHPEWLVRRWIARHGFEAAEQWCRFNNRAPDVTVRPLRPGGPSEVNSWIETLRGAGVEASQAIFASGAITLPPGALGGLPAPIAAALVVQDEASQIAAHAVGATPGDRILDLCASPGAKTVILSADMHQRGMLVASDVRPRRVRLLQRTLRQAGVPACVVAIDGTRSLPFGPSFDRVFVDAPCSGLGVLRRDPDLKWTRQADELPGFASVQQRLLSCAAETVAPGGRLIYSTCSSEPEENDDVVEAFLRADRRFVAEPVSLSTEKPEASTLIDAGGRLRTLPFRDGLDAFFAAVLVRAGV